MGDTKFPLAGEDSTQCIAVPGRRLWGEGQAYMLMEKGLEMLKVEPVPDQSRWSALHLTAIFSQTSCTLRSAVLGPRLLGWAPFLARHTSLGIGDAAACGTASAGRRRAVRLVELTCPAA